MILKMDLRQWNIAIANVVNIKKPSASGYVPMVLFILAMGSKIKSLVIIIRYYTLLS